MPAQGHLMTNVPGPYGWVLPRLVTWIEMPWPLDASSRMARIIVKATRDALKDTLHEYWTVKWRRERFKETARSKYHHLARNAKYKAFKRRRYGSITDHVLKAKSKRVLTQQKPTITAVERAGSGVVVGRAELAPWPWKTKPGGLGITPEDMAVELSRWSQDDVDFAANYMEGVFAKNLNEALANSPRLKKRYAGYTASL